MGRQASSFATVQPLNELGGSGQGIVSSFCRGRCPRLDVPELFLLLDIEDGGTDVIGEAF